MGGHQMRHPSPISTIEEGDNAVVRSLFESVLADKQDEGLSFATRRRSVHVLSTSHVVRCQNIATAPASRGFCSNYTVGDTLRSAAHTWMKSAKETLREINGMRRHDLALVKGSRSDATFS